MKELKQGINVISLVDSTEKLLQECLEITNPAQYTQKANYLKEALANFNYILNHFRLFPFAFWNEFDEEYQCYFENTLKVIDTFQGKTVTIPFHALTEEANCVITENGTRMHYPEQLKKGNPAIGQAWLSNGELVFSPREAIIHSINTTAQRLQKWLIPYRSHIQN